MSNDSVRTGEILFVKCVKDGIPNRDPLRESDARRLFGDDDGRISLSDVSIKRDVRDFVLAKFPDGGAGKDRFVFVRKEFSEKGDFLLGRDGLATTLLERASRSKEADEQAALMKSAFDMRVFGAVFSVGKKSFNQCGPVQFGWAHSLHPVETHYVQGTVVMPSKDAKVTAQGKEEEGKTQGTIWTMYTLPFAVFAMPGVINASIARDTRMTQADVDLVLEALWKGTLARQARGRGIQQPLLLLHVEYTDPFFRIGFLEDTLRLEPERDVWLGKRSPTAVPTSLAEIGINVEKLADRLRAHKSQIARARLWTATTLRLVGTVDAEAGKWQENGG